MVVRRVKRFVRRIGRWVLRLLLVAAAVAVCLVLLFRWVNPPTTWLMLSEWVRLGHIERDWVPLGWMSDHVPLSAAAAEDANFCRHVGFDLDGIRAALSDSSRLRGGSTISQQVAKNVFLWPGRTWTRKGLEAGMTVLLEALWSKRRIMEVYLNVAEFDAGVFGVQAAAQHYWGLDASDLGPLRSGRLMAVLPAPRSRSPVSGDAGVNRRGASIQRGAETIRADGRAACFS
jgi:monofunctional glycosyltransferase